MPKVYDIKNSQEDPLITKSNLETFESSIDARILKVEEAITTSSSGGGSAPLVIIAHCTDGYNGKTITATSKVDGSTYTSKVEEGLAIIKVSMPGEYTLTNDLNDNTASATVGESLKDEVNFSEFHATITVTIPELLIGETIEATDDKSHRVEAKAETTSVTLTVGYAGTWNVGVKGNSYISKQSVSIERESDSKSTSLTVSSTGVPYIKVTLAEEFLNETITCKKDLISLSKENKTGEVSFLLSETGTYTIGLESNDKIQEEVNVQEAKEYSIELNLEDTTVPILTVTSREEDNGKTVKVKKDAHNLEKVLADRKATFILPETGEWTVTCDDYPEITKKVNATENKLYKVALRATIFGLKTKKSESQPKTRVVVDTSGDLNGLTPVSLNTQDGTVDYGDMDTTFLFERLNHVVLKSIDKSEEIELNPNDYSKKLEGGNAPSATLSSNYNQFAKAEKMYIYEYDSGDYEYFFLSDEQVDDKYEPIGFYTENGEADAVYMGSFLGSHDDQGRARSVSGVNVRNYTSYTDWYTATRKTGTDYYMETHAHINLYELAYLMMFQNDDSQTAMGQGRDINGGTSSDHKATQTTGFANTKGPIAYDTSSKAVKFMHIEDFFFNNGYSWEEGIHFYNAKTYVKMKPPYPIKDANGNRSSYTQVTGAAETSGSISASVVSNKWGRIPSAVTGSSSTYQCDDWYPGGASDGTLYACCRGSYGLWSRCYSTFTYTGHDVVARLSLIPS